jgi:sulfur carrier protein ThiS
MKSYVQYEKELLAEFRDRLAKTETIVEVGEVFSQTASKLLKKILPDLDLKPEMQIKFDPSMPRYFNVPEELKSKEQVKDLLEDSDFPAILERFATACNNRRLHLEEVEKTRTAKRPPGTTSP